VSAICSSIRYSCNKPPTECNVRVIRVTQHRLMSMHIDPQPVSEPYAGIALGVECAWPVRYDALLLPDGNPGLSSSLPPPLKDPGVGEHFI